MMVHPQKAWLPYLVATIGFCVSFILWYLLSYDIAYFTYAISLKAFYPWVILVLGCGISILVAIIIRTAQLSHARAISLDKMNEDLKNEIAERMAAEETKQKLEVALLQGQKLQAIGTLAGGIAHDFNNLLYAIIGYSEMAREDIDKNSLTYANLGKILDAAHRGQDLIARILTFSRRQHHEFNTLNLKTTIEAALGLLKPTIPASVIIHFEPLEIYIRGNQTQLHQILVNLINNAVDAMDEEGLITIRMTRLQSDDPYLRRFPDIQAKDYCRLDIIDTGHGMDQQTAKRIFEPFFTTKEVGKGTGLGLSMVHSIIEEHLGEISVTSQLGGGTTFTILLPEYHQ